MSALPDDGAQVFKAHSVRRVDPVSAGIAEALKGVAPLRYIKLFPGRLAASSVLSSEGHNNPVVTVGAEGIVGVELLIDPETRVVQFYAITSAVKGCGRKMWPPSWPRPPRTGTWSWSWTGAAASGDAWPRRTRGL